MSERAALPRLHRDQPSRRRVLATFGLFALAAGASARAATTGLEPAMMALGLEAAAALPQLHALIVLRDGVELEAHAFRGPGLDRTTNVKSVSKTIMSALAGVAIAEGALEGVEQPIAPTLEDALPEDADPRIALITVDHLLTMRAGLARTSGRNYGRWVSSPDWTKDALAQPFVDEPGGRMLYSTGSYHLLSALLTRASGRSTLALARGWLGEPLGIEIPAWTRAPEGVYMGGNEMALTPRALAAFGEMYRRGGLHDGERVLPESWIAASWTPRTRSPFSGHRYGYGWFVARTRGYPVNYARGYGGQMIYVVPDLALTVVMTSDPDSPGREGHVDALHALLGDHIVPAAAQGA
jgi:CubicO group peptidase (beta-lactamase class C family)